MKKTILMMAVMLHCLAAASPSHASWLFYYKPEFRGRVVDKETKEPIEGAVVAVYYKKNTYNLGGGSTRVIHTREVLTDRNGEFVIPSSQLQKLHPCWHME